MSKIALRWISCGLSVLALVTSAGLLITDAKFWIPPQEATRAISSAPLLLVGASFLSVQAILRPPFWDLAKNLLLAATFLLWGAIQLMPQSALSQRLGNLVIALYVLDLAWMTLSSLNSRRTD